MPVEPNGTRLDAVSQVIQLKGEDHRATFVSNVSMDITDEGVYWFEVSLNRRAVTRIPLKIRYERAYVQPWSTYMLEH